MEASAIRRYKTLQIQRRYTLSRAGDLAKRLRSNMDITSVGQSVEVVRKLLEKAVAPGIDDLRTKMSDVQTRIDRLENDMQSRMDRLENDMQSRTDRLETAIARLDGRMDGISSNLAAISTSLAQLAAAIAISSTARGQEEKRTVA